MYANSMHQVDDNFLTRIFLRFYAWNLRSNPASGGNYRKWDNSLWQLAFFSTMLSGMGVLVLATEIGIHMHLPAIELDEITKPSRTLIAAFALPALGFYYLLLRWRFKRFLEHPEAAGRFDTRTDRTKLLMVPLGATLVFLGLATIEGLLLR
jgi:hypothetical protein